ncbi:MAG: NAD-dependent epimerase/dehydratase family protein [Crocinitomicaceae bacterium]|nr:NAD-dependent epimerase/dehydratase family protein [Crocinitomicaceae bacterium]
MSISPNSNFFVTGGTGLVGSHFLFELAKNHKVKSLTRDIRRTQQAKDLFEYYDPENAEDLWKNVEWIEGDLDDIPLLENCLQDIDYVIHAAAFVSFRRRDFNTLLKINFEGTRNLINVCLNAQIKKFVHISSVSVFSKTLDGSPIKESNRWKNDPDNSGYGTSKYLSEREAWRGMEEGLHGIIVNPSIIFGPGNPNESSNRLFVNVLREGKYYPPGANAFVDVRDVVDASIQLLESERNKEQFILNAINESYQNIFSQIAKAAGKNPPAKPISKGMIRFVYTMETLLKIFGRHQKLTRENIRSMFKVSKFDGSKIQSEMNFDYRKMEDTIQNSLDYLKKKKLL